MKIALSIWKDCISTVFDTADQLWIFEPDGTGGYKRTPIKTEFCRCKGTANEMKELQIVFNLRSHLSPLENMLIALGITVYSFVRGTVEEIIAAYQTEIESCGFCFARLLQTSSFTGENAIQTWKE
jgi:hypothetical protein